MFWVWVFRCYAKITNLCGSNICSVFPALLQAISNASWLEESILGLKNPQIPLTRKKSIFGALIQFFPLSFKWIPSTCCSMHFDFNRLNKVFETKMYLQNVNFARFSFSRIKFLYSVLFRLTYLYLIALCSYGQVKRAVVSSQTNRLEWCKEYICQIGTMQKINVSNWNYAENKYSQLELCRDLFVKKEWRKKKHFAEFLRCHLSPLQ